VQDEGAPVTGEVLRSMETCVQCLGCETACPSGVPFGHLMEGTRAALAAEGHITPRWQRLGLRLLRHRRLLLAGSTLLALAGRLRLLPARRLGLPARLPLRRGRHRASGSDVWLFTGCVMDAWQRHTHLAVQRVLEAAGVGVTPTAGAAPCCGALHAHAGLAPDAAAMARQVMAALSGDDRPVLVDSAGCGAVLKDYGKLIGTAEAEAFSQRVMDVHEWLVTRLHMLPSPGEQNQEAIIAVHDPCHLRHVQRAHQPVVEVLARYATVVALDDDGLCCGAGGAYAAMQPELAASIRERKLEAIRRSGAGIVASANPGCTIHLANAGMTVRHPLEILDEILEEILDEASEDVR